jgi:hypothetical protein
MKLTAGSPAIILFEMMKTLSLRATRRRASGRSGLTPKKWT